MLVGLITSDPRQGLFIQCDSIIDEVPAPGTTLRPCLTYWCRCLSIATLHSCVFAHKLPFGASTLAPLETLFQSLLPAERRGLLSAVWTQACPNCLWGPTFLLCEPQSQNEQMSREKKVERFEALDVPISLVIYFFGTLYFQSTFTLPVLLPHFSTIHKDATE